MKTWNGHWNWKQTGWSTAMLPKNDGDTVRVVDGSLEARKFVALYGRDGRLSGAVAMNRMRKLVEWRKALHEDLSFDEALVRAKG